MEEIRLLASSTSARISAKLVELGKDPLIPKKAKAASSQRTETGDEYEGELDDQEEEEQKGRYHENE